MPSVKPKLTNRGPAGLLTSVNGTPDKALSQQEMEDAVLAKAKKDNITPMLKALAVPIAKLTPDPNNAREHPDRNMRSIMLSLAQYGQAKPIVVRKSDNVVIAGNGTLKAAELLGWTKIAANIVDYDTVEAVGLGLADNRSAELARWNFETVKRLDKIIQEQQHCPVGWTSDELEVLRAATWNPPPIEDLDFSADTAPEMSQERTQAIALVKDLYEGGDKWTDEEAIEMIVQEWLTLRQPEEQHATGESEEATEAA